MISRRKMAVLFLLCSMHAPVLALEGDAERFPKQMEVGDVQLVRRGVGRMRRWFITGVDVALYTEPGLKRGALLEDVPRALSLYYYVNIRGDQFAGSGLETLKENSPGLLGKHRAELATFHAGMQDVGKGDRYLLTYIPGDGTTLYLNGEKLVHMPGASFGELYFRIWLGKPSIDARMYEALVADMQP